MEKIIWYKIVKVAFCLIFNKIMKYLPWASLIIAGIVVINEIAWIGKSDLVWVLIGLGVSVILLAVYQIAGKKE